MPNMSFSFTVAQVRDRSKTVTRRLGWWDLEPGTELVAVEKAMGLRKGEKVTPICRIRVLSVRTEEVYDITQADVAREGFPNYTRDDFITFFCQQNKCQPDDLVNRIEFEYIDEDLAA